MTEINLATADKATLKAYAANNLDLALSLTMSEQTMRERIVARAKELNVELPMAEITLKGTAGQADKANNVKRIVINIAKQDKPGGAEPALVGVQGVLYSIPRGIEIAVPPAIVEVLKNAVQDIVTQDPVTGAIHHEPVLTHPYQIIREVA